MGMGDVKLALVIGIVLGALGLRYVGVAAAGAVLFGGIGGIVALATGRDRKSTIPFGPYMAAGAVVAAFWGERIADWYLRLVHRRSEPSTAVELEHTFRAHAFDQVFDLPCGLMFREQAQQHSCCAGVTHVTMCPM